MTLLIAALVLAPIRVACVGDSITWGAGTQDPKTQSYPAQLQRMLGDGYTVGNFGHSGATLSRSGNLPYWNVAEFKQALEFQPQIVVIMLGTNDANPVNWTRSKNSFVPEYEELLRVFRALPSHPKVFVCLPVPNFEGRKTNVDEAVIPLTKQIARETDAPLIDLYAPLEDSGALFPDRLHPNQEGAGIMAETVAEGIEDAAARKKLWKVASVDSEQREEGPARDAIDGDTYTYWHTAYAPAPKPYPHEIVVDMGQEEAVAGFRYLPRQDGGVNGRVKGFELYLSDDGKTWGEPVAKGEIPDILGWTAIKLDHPQQARFFRFRALSEQHGGPWASVGELDIRRAPR